MALVHVHVHVLSRELVEYGSAPNFCIRKGLANLVYVPGRVSVRKVIAAEEQDLAIASYYKP